MAGLASTIAPLIYVASAVAFFLGLQALCKLRTAPRGRPLIGVGLLLALIGTLVEQGGLGERSSALLGALALGAAGGAILAVALPKQVIPPRVTLFPALAGGAVVLAALEILLRGQVPLLRGVAAVIALVLGLLAALGAMLGVVRQESARANAAAALVASAAGLGLAALGVALSISILIIVGGLVGAAAITVARRTAVSAGQPLLALLGGALSNAEASGYRHVRSCGSDEAALVLQNAHQVVVLPGFGMAAAQAQHALKEMAELLEKQGTQVTWVVHPAAGCLPGHMNILLDEADVKHDRVLDLSEAQEALARADAALVVGANDVVNPAAMSDPSSPVFGMDVPGLAKVRSVFVVKRSLRPGAAGVRNELFEQPNAALVFGDAKKVAQALVAELKGAGAH